MAGSRAKTISYARNIPEPALLKLMILSTWDSCLRESLEVPKGVKPLVLNVLDRGVVMEPMQGKLASSQFDFGYTEQFYIPGVTSVCVCVCVCVCVYVCKSICIYI